MRKVHKHLHLQHHRHTGRVLHHRHTSYRALALIITLASSLVIALNIMARAAADDIHVYARNPAPIPTEPAVITNPANGTVTTKARLDVSGTCPVMTVGVIVGILDNGVLAGTTPCNNDGTFALPLAITPGKHVLIARTYTITGDTGPDSDEVIVFLTLFSGSVAPIDDQNGRFTGLTVTIDTPFVVFGPVKNAVWQGTITGGITPYKVHIDWGDGNSDDYVLNSGGKQEFTHHYRSMQPHIITMRVTDPHGRGALRTYAAVTPYVSPVFGGVTAPHWNGSTPLGLYGAYLLLLVVFGGLWARAHPFAYAAVPVRKRSYAAVRRKHKARAHS